MPVLFTETLAPGQYLDYETEGWTRDAVVFWSVRPSPGQVGTVSLRALAIESNEDGTLSYILTVWNVSRGPITFDALYSLQDMVMDAAAQSFTLGAGKQIGLAWNFNLAPALVTLIPIPQHANATFECSTPAMTLNADGSATYDFTVTNTGASTAAFHMRAGLQF